MMGSELAVRLRRARAAIVLAATLLGATGAWAQVVADPNDPLYEDLDIWQEKGYLTNLPPLRPYPVQLVQAALEEVAHRARGVDAAVARRYLASLQKSFLPLPLYAAATYELQTKNQDAQNRAGLDLSSTGLIGKRLGYSIRGLLLLESSAGEEVFPRWDVSSAATVENEAIGSGTRAAIPISIGGTPLEGYGVLGGMISFGTDRLWVQAGLVRSSFGPVAESPVLGPQAPQAGHFSATYRGRWFTYTTLVEELVARYGVRANGEVYSLKGSSGSGYPQKYLFVQSLDFHPARWVDLGVFQTEVTGGRFSPAYLLPFPLYTQAYLGDWDNSFVGASATLTLPYGIRPWALLYIDDLRVSRLLKLDFDTNGNKVAIQAGLDWTGPLAIPNKVSLSYTAITPYMYTHFSRQAINYLQYTNLGQQLGSILPPNSDQWSARIEAMPMVGLRLEAWGKRIRHGNGSDYGEGSVDGDGSVYDDGQLEDGTTTFLDRSSFLTQAVLERDLQIGLNASLDLRLRGVRAQVGAGYTLEIVENRNLDPAAGKETNHHISLNLTIGL